MDTCDKKIIKTGLDFVMAVDSNTKPLEILALQLLESLQAYTSSSIRFNANDISKHILAAASVPKTQLLQTTRMTEKQLDSTIKAAESFASPDSLLGKIKSIPGFETLDSMIETINVKSLQVKQSVEAETRGDLQEQADFVEKRAGNSLVELEASGNTLFSPNGTLLTDRRQSRIERTKGLKINSAASWSVFLDEHFTGMSGMGIEFSEFARNEIFEAMVDFYSPAEGFTDDINTGINSKLMGIQQRINALKINKYSDRPLKDDLKDNKSLRDRYFYEVLSSDFDFILESLVGSVHIKLASTENGNSEVTGLIDENGDEIESTLFNISSPDLIGVFKESTAKAKGDTSYTFQRDDVQIYALPRNSVEFLADRTLKRDRIYYLKADNRYFFRDRYGKNTDISPVKVYAYSTKNNRRSEGIDQEMNPFDMSTAFIVNLMPMFKLKNADGSFGRRMNASDFLVIAPHLKGVGNDIDDFKDALLSKASGDTLIAKIARSLYTYVYSNTVTDGVHSLYAASQHPDSMNIGKTNDKIVIALQNALMNFDFNRYIKQEQKYVTTTYALGEGSQDDAINNGLAPYIVKNGYTKPVIAKNLVVNGNTVSIKDPVTGKQYTLEEIFRKNFGKGNSSGVPNLETVARNAGMSNLRFILSESFNKSFTTSDDAHAALLTTFENIFITAAANLKVSPLRSRSLSDKVIKHSAYRRTPASSILPPLVIKNVVAVAFDIDNNKRINAGGKKLPSVEAPNRYTLLKKQVEMYKKALKINGGVLDFNPFLMTAEQLKAKESNLYAATIGDVFIKTPIMYDGDAIAVSEWDIMTRVKHAMIDGFLDGPKLKGMEFFVQAMNFSDKSAIPLQQVFFKENLLAKGVSTSNRLIAAYIEYNINKNVGLQKIMIGHLGKFVGGQYESIVKHIEESAVIYKETEKEKNERLTDLRKLRDILVNKSYLSGGVDMTRPINALLMKINISEEFIKFSDTELDAGADTITFGKNPIAKYAGMALLKPHMGIRAEAYNTNGPELVKQSLLKHRTRMQELGLMEDKEITAALKKVGGKQSNVLSNKAFIDRFFLINGIYGHAVKVVSMGDEAYFSAKYEQKSITEYYDNIDRSVNNLKYINDDGEVEFVKEPDFNYGLAEVEGMLQSQFKRAQSILTRGISYMHKKTAVGLKRSTIKEDALQYMDIRSSLAKNSKGEIETKYNYEFTSLYGKTFEELEGLGILTKLPADGPLGIRNADNSVTVSFKVGNSTIIMSNTKESIDALVNRGVDTLLVTGLYNLMENIERNTEYKGLEKASYTVSSHYDQRPDTEAHLSVHKLRNVEKSLSSNTFAVMPDFIPSMTLSDPVSFVNVLNKMNVRQENSDAIQFIHPLLAMILDNSRGNSMGAFHTEAQEAMKFLTTTVEYDKARQILQKKSIQNPFTFEQMSKLGGPELFNMLRTMNTAMEFKQTNMLVENNGVDEFMEFKNLEDLFNHFKGYVRGDDSAWADVLETLGRKENIVNLYNFVGLVSVPSNQKTGHKKLNKFEKNFNHRLNDSKPNIDYTANEFNLEVLSKAHSYDVSGQLRDKSTIALLSQLVSAVAVGGNTNEIAEDLQNGMSAMMDHSRMQIGAEFAHIASELSFDEDYPLEAYSKVSDRLAVGNFTTTGFNEVEQKVYSKIIRKGVYDIIILALDNDMESEVIKKIAQEQDLSVDHPGAKRQIMNTLRAALFKDSIKMDMSGFIATVSVGSNTMKMFTLTGGRRAARGSYIIGQLKNGEGTLITKGNLDDVASFVLPYDFIQIQSTDKKGKPITKLVRAGDPVEGLTYTRQDNGTYKITGFPEGAKVIFTPDVNDAPGIRNQSTFSKLDEDALIAVSGFGIPKPGVYYKWFFEELHKDPERRKEYFGNMAMDKLLRGQHLAVDITEKYSLQWTKYTRVNSDGKTIKLESTDAYKAFYRAAFNKKISEKALDNLRAVLILETQKRDADGNNIWQMTAAETVLPTFMRAAYNIPQGTSLYDIIGYKGDIIDNVVEYFTGRVRLGKKYMPLGPDKDGNVYLQKVRRIYTRELTNKNNHSNEKSNYAKAILRLLNDASAQLLSEYGVKDSSQLTAKQFEEFNDRQLTESQIKDINYIIQEAKGNHIRAMADSFIKSLDVVLTRIPGQTKQSGFFANVVEFLDAQGNAAFAPTEHLVTTGGDFDIDTLSVLTRAIDEKGIIYNSTDFLINGRFSIQKLQEAYQSDLLNDKDDIMATVEESNRRYAELVRIRKQKLSVETDPAKRGNLENQILLAEQANISEKDMLQLFRKSQRSIAKKYKNVLSNVINGAIMDALQQVDTAVEMNTPMSFSLFTPILKRLEEKVIVTATVNTQKSEEELKNLPVYSVDGINTMDTTAKEVEYQHYGNPWSATNMPGTIKVASISEAVSKYKSWLTTSEYDSINPEQKAWILNEIKKGAFENRALLYANTQGPDGGPILSHAEALAEITAKAPKGSDISGENYMAIFDAEYTAAQGKEAIAIFATVLKLTSSFQSAKMVFDKRYADSNDFKGVKNPFFFNHTISYSKKGAEGKLEKQVVSRHTFADTERYSIMNKLKVEGELKDALMGIGINDFAFGKKAPQALVDLIEEEMFEILKKTNKISISDFTVEQNKKLSKYYGRPIGSDLAGELLARFQTNKKIPQSEIIAVLDATGLDISNPTALATYKLWLQSKNIVVDKVLFKSISKDLFGISLSEDILQSQEPLKAFREYLESDIRVVENALKNAVGKTLSMDVQSQFLSAATDNAKELILARVKSNTLTNPIITAMMLLGYDINVIIDFLHDPIIEKIIFEFSKRKNELQNVSLTASGVSDLAVGGTAVSGSKSSLISILAIGEEFNKFRAVRSLNENNKIRQEQLDKIINDVEYKLLYPALNAREAGETFYRGKLTDLNFRADKKQTAKNDIQDVFNVEQMILLNTITSKIFKHIFEVERHILPAISHNTTILREIAEETRGAGKKEYQNIESFLSSKIVASFYSKSIGTRKRTNDNGKIEIVPRYRTGDTYIDGKLKHVELNSPAGKAEFVDNFESYFNHMKELIDGNAALNSMVFGKTYNATGAVLGIPKLRHAQPYNIDVSNILQGLKELKSDLNDSFSESKLSLYNNLAHYAMIVSSGEIKKGTMIDVFLEINYELAAFVNTLTIEDYRAFIPKTELGITLVKGNYPTIEKLNRYAERRRANNQYSEQEIEQDAFFEESAGIESANSIEHNMELFDPSFDESGYDMDTEKKRYDALSAIAASPMKVTNRTGGEIFRVIDRDIPDAIFYGHNPGQIAYRIFPAGSAESNPIATLPTTKHLTTVNKKFMQDLADIGMQIGYTAKYGNEDIQILNYKTTEKIDGHMHDVYTIWSNGKLGTALGIHLMQDNEGLDLRKNVIRPVRSGDADRYNNYRAALDKLPEITKEIGVVASELKYAPKMAAAFKNYPNVLAQNIVAQKEARQIASVITLDKKSIVRENDVHNIYYESTDLSKATKHSRLVLVPSMFKAGGKTVEITEQNQIIQKVADILNNMEVGDVITLYGIKSEAQTHFVGGMDIVDKTLTDLWDNMLYDTFFNGHFTVDNTEDPESGMITRRINRNKTNDNFRPIMKMVDGKIIPIFTQDKVVNDVVVGTEVVYDKYTRRPGSSAVTEKDYKNAGVAAMFDEELDVPYKKGKLMFGGMKSTDYIVLPLNDKDVLMYVRNPEKTNDFFPIQAISYENRFHQVSQKGQYMVSREEFNKLKDMDGEPNSGEIIKKGC